MRTVSILSILFLGGIAGLAASCSSDKTTPTPTPSESGGTNAQGGQANAGAPAAGTKSGGTPSNGGTPQQTGGTQQTGGVGETGGMGETGGAPETGGSPATGGGTTGPVGTTSPANAIQLPNDYMSGSIHGYCYTFGDFTKDPLPTTPSSVSPPCNGGACFTAATGMCIAGSLGIAQASDSYAAYGVGIGCAVAQDEAPAGETTPSNPISVASMTNILVTIYGDTMPANVQFSVEATDGTQYCARAVPTANTPITVPLSSLKTNCWPYGTPQNPFDPATMQITKLQMQLVTGGAVAPYDMCVSQFTIQ